MNRILYTSPAVSVACYRAARYPRPNRQRPAAWLRLARTALAAILGITCACGAAFTVGAILGPMIGFVPAFFPAAVACYAVLCFFRNLSSF
jgi:hypothetical protein